MIEKGAPNTEALTTIYNTVQALPVSERAELIHRMLGDSGLSVVLGDGKMNDRLADHLNTMETAQLAKLVRAIANRIDSGE